MCSQSRRSPRSRNERDAERAEERAGDVSSRPEHNARTAIHPALNDVRLHRGGPAASITRALGAQAATVGSDIYFSSTAPRADSAPGRRLLAHELTHVVQQHEFGRSVQFFVAAERPSIAPDLSALMVVIQTLVTASSSGDQVNMDALVRHAGGAAAGAALPGPLKSVGPTTASMLSLRYLFTSRCGLVDMRHLIQLMYISWFMNFGQAGSAARAATRRGVEHEQTSEPASKFAPEDLTSNALGAWTATQLAGLPQRDALTATIKRTLELCGPVEFNKLSAASRDAVVDFYAAQTGAGEPLNQNREAVALIPKIPELAGSDRSFPFDLDTDDPNRTTIDSAAFSGGVYGLTGDTEIREFVDVQREEILRSIPQKERVRLCRRLMKGWVSGADVDAFERLYRLGDAPSRTAIRAAVAPSDLSGGQRTRLRVLYAASP